VVLPDLDLPLKGLGVVATEFTDFSSLDDCCNMVI